MPLLLGSWLGLLVLPLILGAFSVRIFIEESALQPRPSAVTSVLDALCATEA
jgi:protein-S-isoprenylcysteine O-methyltransferase Ste14